MARKKADADRPVVTENRSLVMTMRQKVAEQRKPNPPDAAPLTIAQAVEGYVQARLAQITAKSASTGAEARTAALMARNSAKMRLHDALEAEVTARLSGHSSPEA